jgi:hypothetical protein
MLRGAATWASMGKRSTRIGRNDMCPCGSGKKYKKCCENRVPNATELRPANVTPAPISMIPPAVIQRFAEHQRRERERVNRFGQVRPEIALDYHGYKLVAVGSKLFYEPSEKCKFFPDFLLSYAQSTFGRDWHEAEIAKQPEERHPVMQWRVKAMNYMNKQPPLPDGTYSAVPSGFMAAYLAFAYDLYVVEHNARLDQRLLERLKHPDQFQGARHELFAEATCLRAAFEIEHENESDPTRRHAEFTATHKATGQKISVEAKSKHRPGVLGRAGAPEPADELNLRFGRLLRDAVQKNVPHPLVVFLDTNLPLEVAEQLFGMPTPNSPIPAPHFNAMLDDLRKEHNGKDPANLIVFTNHPHHYAKDEEVDPRRHLLSVFSQIPAKPIAHPEALAALHQAANIYGNIPNKFPTRD